MHAFLWFCLNNAIVIQTNDWNTNKRRRLQKLLKHEIFSVCMVEELIASTLYMRVLGCNWVGKM